MKRIVLAFVVAASLSFAATIHASSINFDAVRPFQLEATDLETKKTFLLTVCSTWATVIDGKVVWLTAAHCVASDDPDEHNGVVEEMWVDGQRAYPTVVDFVHDIAVLRGGPSVRNPLVISFKASKILDALVIAGFPHGSKSMHVLAGTFAAKDDGGVDVYAVPVMGGMSGGPVFDVASGTVVGLVAQSECATRAWCSVSRGLPLSVLRSALKLDDVEP